MALLDGQVQVRDLVIGDGTPYRMLDDFNPFEREARADQTAARAWNHGSWSGAEWAEQAVVPMRIRVKDQHERTPGRWLELHQQLAAAFRPVGDTVEDVELRFGIGGREYLMFGRPRMVRPEVSSIRRGYSHTQAAFVALDPLIYDGVETVVSAIELPTFTGGMQLPVQVPFTVTGVAAAGFADLTNQGTADVGLLLRLDGPVVEPRVTLTRADGSFQTLVFDLELLAGQWLDVDTRNRVVLLNGTSSRRGDTSGHWPILPPGKHTLRWTSPQYNDVAELSARFRSAWW